MAPVITPLRGLPVSDPGKSDFLEYFLAAVTGNFALSIDIPPELGNQRPIRPAAGQVLPDLGC